jgi:hypothetical protein
MFEFDHHHTASLSNTRNPQLRHEIAKAAYLESKKERKKAQQIGRNQARLQRFGQLLVQSARLVGHVKGDRLRFQSFPTSTTRRLES